MSAASSSREAKLAKLQQFKANLPSHTQAALHAMVEEAKNTGLPELSRQGDQVAARRQMLDSCHEGHLGPLIQTASLVQEDGQKVKMFFCHPLVYLASLFARGGSFTKLIQEMHAIQPSRADQPWDLCLYADEIIPGHVLGRDDGVSTPASSSSSTISAMRNHGYQGHCAFHLPMTLQLSMVLADGAAHKQIWGSKGDADQILHPLRQHQEHRPTNFEA